VLAAVVLIVSALLGNLFALAVTQIYPDIDPDEVHGHVNAVLSYLTGLGFVWYYRR